MDISFEQLKSMVVFAQVVERGSFSAAAKHMGLSRAVVSYHINKLESQLEIQLLNRSTRTMAMTEAGKSYYDRCRVIAEQAAHARQQIEDLKNEPQGKLKLSCPVNVGLELIVPALNSFKKHYPRIELDLDLTDKVVNILQDGFDLAIRGAPLPDSELQATLLTTLSTCLCAAPDYLQQHGTPGHPSELEHHQWVIYKQQASHLTLTKGNRHYDIPVKGSIQTNNAAARTAFVMGGHGLARVPLYDAKDKIASGALVPILNDFRTDDIQVFGVFPPGTARSKKLRLLLDYLKDYFHRLAPSR